MGHFEQVIFIALILIFGFLLWTRIRFIKSAILLGRPLDRFDNPAERWKRVLLIAFGQKKMFRRLIPALLHLFLYLGFIIINLEILEFLLDGITGRHRLFPALLNQSSDAQEYYSSGYNTLMNAFEFLVVAVIIACVFFLIRRNILKVPRFKGIEMTRWPKLDANLILVFEIVLMVAILLMNGADQLLQKHLVENYPATGDFLISKWMVIPVIKNLPPATLIVIERTAWWFHILGILGFALYVTYSKHLHIILAFPNTYYSSLRPPAEIPVMDVVTREVNMMLGIGTPGEENQPSDNVETLGACKVQDLTWKNLMDAFTCTECGRCTSVCPAHITGKKLSPRKILMDVRDIAEKVVRSANNNNDHSLFDSISKEELFACTTCNACIDVCPVSIDPVSIILEMRRYTVMEESSAPVAWNMMFNNIETNAAPWKFPASDRFRWAEEVNKK